MKRAIFLVMVALLAMLVLAPMGLAQETTMVGGTPPPTGGLNPSTGILLPAAALLLGSGILSYAILRRR